MFTRRGRDDTVSHLSGGGMSPSSFANDFCHHLKCHLPCDSWLYDFTVGETGLSAAAKAAKKAKAVQKIERKEAKKVGKSKKDGAVDEEDLEAILDNVGVL